MQRNDSKKKATDQPKKRQTPLGSTMTPDRKPTVGQLLRQMEKEQNDHNKHFQEMRSYYEAKLIRFDAMQVRYMAAREHQETLIARIKQLENDLIEMRNKKELIEAELNRKKSNEQSTSSTAEKLAEPINELEATKCIEKDNEIQDVKERLKRAEENLAIANEMVTQRDEAIIELGKRISSLKRLARKAVTDNDQVGDSESCKKQASKASGDISQDSSWDSDSEFLDLLVIIDEVDDEEDSTDNGSSNIGKENQHPTMQSDGQTHLTAFQKRRKTIEHKLSQLSSLIESTQKNLLSTKSELKEKSAIECDLRKNVAKLQFTVEKLKEECEQLRATTTERSISEVKKLMERLRDLETISENAVKSAELSNNAFIRMGHRKNQYRDMFSSSIDEIDQLCVILKRYVNSERYTPEPGVNKDICVEMDDHLEVSSQTRDSKSTTALLKSTQKAAPTTDIPLCANSIDGCKSTESSFLSDCSIATLDRTCFIQADISMQPEVFKKPHQKQRVVAIDSLDSANLSKQRNENRGEWLSAKRSHQHNNS